MKNIIIRKKRNGPSSSGPFGNLRLTHFYEIVKLKNGGNSLEREINVDSTSWQRLLHKILSQAL